MKDKVNLLVVKGSMPLGGAEAVIVQQLRHLDRSSFNVHLTTLKNKGDLLQKARFHSDSFLKNNRITLLDPIVLFRLYYFVKINSINIVHCHDWLSMLYFYIIRKFTKITLVSTVHSMSRGWREIISDYLLKRCDVVVCICRTQKYSLFEKGIPWSKLKIVYNCYDSDVFNSTSNKKESKGKAFKIVMVGNYYWQKDQYTLIKAIEKVLKNGINIELHLVGKAKSNIIQRNKELVKSFNIDPPIVFHYNKQVTGKFLRRFDLFVFSSKSERFPVAPIEAMACSLPVLVSDIPPNMELIRNGKDGFYFETASSYDCANKIMDIINNPIKRKEMADLGYTRSKQFTPDIIVRQLEQLYKKMVFPRN